MQVCEIFYSLQGESSFAGLPCVFVRLAGCNLRCAWCDTSQAFRAASEYTVDQVLEEVRKYPCRLVEITGGEPLLQPESLTLMENLDAWDYALLLETNGTLSIQNVPARAHVIMDVKLPGSGHPGSFLESNLERLRPGRDELKFVIKDRADFDQAVDFIRSHALLDFCLLCSPVANELEPNLLAHWILGSGLPLKLNLQLHKLLDLD